MLSLHGRLAVPGYTLTRVDRAPQQPVFVGAPEAELRELVAEICGSDKELAGLGFVVFDAVDTDWFLV